MFYFFELFNSAIIQLCYYEIHLLLLYFCKNCLILLLLYLFLSQYIMLLIYIVLYGTDIDADVHIYIATGFDGGINIDMCIGIAMYMYV